MDILYAYHVNSKDFFYRNPATKREMLQHLQNILSIEELKKNNIFGDIQELARKTPIGNLQNMIRNLDNMNIHRENEIHSFSLTHIYVISE